MRRGESKPFPGARTKTHTLGQERSGRKKPPNENFQGRERVGQETQECRKKQMRQEKLLSEEPAAILFSTRAKKGRESPPKKANGKRGRPGVTKESS